MQESRNLMILALFLTALSIKVSAESASNIQYPTSNNWYQKVGVKFENYSIKYIKAVCLVSAFDLKNIKCVLAFTVISFIFKATPKSCVCIKSICLKFCQTIQKLVACSNFKSFKSEAEDKFILN